MGSPENVQVPVAEQQDWKGEIQKKLDERGIIAVEGCGVLTANDVLSAIDVIDTLETTRDETEEWNHIKNLKQERAKRLSGGNPN